METTGVLENPELIKIINKSRRFGEEEFQLIKDRDILGPFSGWCLLMNSYYPDFNENTANIISEELKAFEKDFNIELEPPEIYILSYYVTANNLANRYTDDQVKNLLEWQFNRIQKSPI